MKYSIYLFKSQLWLLFVLMLAACSSEYVPSEKMLAYKKNLTSAQAVDIIQKWMSSTEKLEGICATRGFWFDSGADFKVDEKSISMVAYKRGKLLEKHQQKLGDIVVFERQYYQYDFKFDHITSINIYGDSRDIPVFTECNKEDHAGSYYIIDFYIDKATNMKMIVLKENFDQAMAAVSLLVPSVPVYMH